MILIAESGSSKTDWVLVDKYIEYQRETAQGINPYFDNEEEIIKKIPDTIDFDLVDKLFFFGPGLLNPEKQQFLYQVFLSQFGRIEISVKSDIYASAIAGFGSENGIAGILGTGAATAYFENLEIKEMVSSLGFILGDEGSGASIGKKFIKLLLENELNSSLVEAFKRNYTLDKFEVFQNVYNSKMPSKYLASFVPFVFQNKNDEQIKSILQEEFSLFFEKNILKYSKLDQAKISLSGSIAYYFEQEITQVASKFNLKLNNIVHYPINGLVEYYKKFG